MKVRRQHPSLATPRGSIRTRARHTVYLALAALAVGCGQDLTAPPVTRAPAIPKGADPDIVVMQRTIDIAAHDGVAAVHQTSRQTLTGQVRVAKQNQLPGAAAGQNPGFDVEHLPRPAISLAARAETAMCSALPSWKQTMKTGAVTGGDVEMTGVGDAPASTLRIMQNGKNVVTVERTWVRTPTSWQLERQVTTSSDGRFRDEVTYQHLTASRQPLNNALPVATCVTPLNATTASPAMVSRSYYAPSGNPSLSRWAAPTGTSAYYGDGCDSYGGDPCFDKQQSVYKADGALAVASAAVTIACWPPLTLTPPCALAGVAYGAAVLNLALAKRSLDNCRAEQAAGTGGGNTAFYSYGTIGTNGRSSVSAPSGTSGTVNAPPTSPSYICGYDGGGGGGGGGGSPGGGSCSYEVWEISYDGGASWSYWGTFWTCIAMT